MNEGIRRGGNILIKIVGGISFAYFILIPFCAIPTALLELVPCGSFA